jgi:hypothetical protein
MMTHSFRQPDMTEFSELLAITQLTPSILKKHINSEDIEPIVLDVEGKIAGFVCRSFRKAKGFGFGRWVLFDWSGESGPRETLLRECLSALNVDNQNMVLYVASHDEVGKKMLPDFKFIQSGERDGIEIWHHRYHPDNLYYKETYFG